MHSRSQALLLSMRRPGPRHLVSLALTAGGAAFNSDTDSIKAVIWWYDRNADDLPTESLPEVHLRLYAGGTLRRSSTTTDNRQMVYFSGIGNLSSPTLEIEGVSIPAAVDECGGTGKLKVYYAWLAEDDDRDESDNLPDYNSTTCVGVQTQ